MKIIDVHTHGIAGYDTRTSSAGDILKMAEIQGALGVSAIVPTIYAGTIGKMRGHLAAVKAAMEARSHSSSEVAGGGSSAILGAHLEGPFLNARRAGALDPAVFLAPEERAFRALIEGFEDTVRIITLSPELPGALSLIRQIADRGIAVSMGHTEATFAEAEAGYNHGAKGVTHLMNAMRPYHHREPGIVGFALLNPHVYTEVIADSFHLHVKTLELIFRTKALSRVIIVSDSVKETPGFGRDTEREPIRDGEGILQGGAMTIAESARWLSKMGFNRDAVNAAVSINPSTYLGL